MKNVCSTCNKNYSTKTNLRKHRRIIHNIIDAYTCECGNQFNNAQSLNVHYRWCVIHRLGKLPSPSGRKGKVSPFKGKKIEEIVNNPEEIRKKISKGRIGKGIAHTEHAKKKISMGRILFLESDKSHVKWFNINGIKVQGNWERLVAETLIKNNISFVRKRLNYDGYRTYTPDFYLTEYDIFIEVKGWLSDTDKEKYRKVFISHPNVKIKLIRDELGINNFTKFINEQITIFDCEDLKNAI